MTDIGANITLTAKRVAQRLHQFFDDSVEIDNQVYNKDEKENRFLTQSYMALSLIGLTNADKYSASCSITDGYDDEGIDCIFYDSRTTRLYIGQSKWFNNTSKGVSLSDFVRFRDGVKRLIDLRFDDQNKDLHKHQSKVKQALEDINCQIHLILAHNSEKGLSEEIKRYRDEFINQVNDFEPIMRFDEFNLRQAAEVARTLARPENINVQAMMRNWGHHKNPYKAVYGAISASDVVDWYEANGKGLFAENLRYGIERSDVNEGISRTARFDPEKFWYFNNGITAICDDFSKQRIGGESTESGVFDIKRISIINGAQTVSSLFKSKKSGADLKNIDIQMRIISLLGTPEGFAVEVTTANNTQNDLNPVDFVAADPNQDRIRQESLKFNVVYTFRRGDDEPHPSNGFGIRDATVAAACASGDLKLAVGAKRYISGLWENTKKAPYTTLFNEKTSAWWLWNSVRISRAVDNALTDEAEKLGGRENLIAIHSNRFVLYLTFNNLDFKVLDNKPQSDEDISKAEIIAKGILAKITEIVGKRYPEAYPGNIFKNAERQAEIEKELIEQSGRSNRSENGHPDLFTYKPINPRDLTA